MDPARHKYIKINCTFLTVRIFCELVYFKINRNYVSSAYRISGNLLRKAIMKNISLIIICLCAFAASAQEVVSEKIYRTTEVDQKPNLKDGMYTFSMFISENFKFPEIRNKKIKIFTSFVIEPDGRMTDVKAFYISAKDYLPTDVVKIQTEEEKQMEVQLYDAMKAEAARVVTIFNQSWIPAVKDGMPVRCLYNYPINFNLE